MPAWWLSWQRNIADVTQGNGVGYLSVAANMQKSKPCTLSTANRGATLVSVLPNLFPLRVKQMLKPPGRSNRAPFAKPPQGLPGSTWNPHVKYPNLTELTVLWGLSQPLGASCLPMAAAPGVHAPVPTAGGGKASA